MSCRTNHVAPAEWAAARKIVLACRVDPGKWREYAEPALAQRLARSGQNGQTLWLVKRLSSSGMPTRPST